MSDSVKNNGTISVTGSGSTSSGWTVVGSSTNDWHMYDELTETKRLLEEMAQDMVKRLSSVYNKRR